MAQRTKNPDDVQVKMKLVKRGKDHLTPLEPADQDLLDRIKHGDVLECTYVRKRNARFHRKFFALLNLGFTYWEPPAGAISQAEQVYVDGYIRFVAAHIDHLDTLQEFELAYRKEAMKRRFLPDSVTKSKEAFRRWVLIEAGFYEDFILPNGTIRREPRSISFSRMSEDSFTEVYSAVKGVLWNMILVKKFDSPEEAEQAVWRLLEHDT